jgi:hypothetical protein
MELFVFPSIALCATTMVDLWMSKSSFITFALVIKFINEEWVPCHVVVDMFEALNPSGATLVEQVKSFLVEYQLTTKIIVYVKDEGANLNTIIIALTYVVSCALIRIASSFIDIFFLHFMSKAC